MRVESSFQGQIAFYVGIVLSFMWNRILVDVSDIFDFFLLGEGESGAPGEGGGGVYEQRRVDLDTPEKDKVAKWSSAPASILEGFNEIYAVYGPKKPYKTRGKTPKLPNRPVFTPPRGGGGRAFNGKSQQGGGGFPEGERISREGEGFQEGCLERVGESGGGGG